jgi:hypothetical protein
MLQRIERFGEQGAFQPDEVRILVAAFDDAWASVRTSGAPFAEPAYQETARDIIAKSIIDAAKTGERNQRALTEAALLQLSKANLRKSHTSKNAR